MTDRPEVTAAGEYGASSVAVARDGSLIRVAFGRQGDGGVVYHGAVLLAEEAARELFGKLKALGFS